MTPTTPHNNEALEAFDEILTLLSANQRGIVEFLEQKVRDSLTRANQRASEAPPTAQGVEGLEFNMEEALNKAEWAKD